MVQFYEAPCFPSRNSISAYLLAMSRQVYDWRCGQSGVFVPAADLAKWKVHLGPSVVFESVRVRKS